MNGQKGNDPIMKYSQDHLEQATLGIVLQNRTKQQRNPFLKVNPKIPDSNSVLLEYTS